MLDQLPCGLVVEMRVDEPGVEGLDVADETDGEVGTVITMIVEPGRDDFAVAVGTTIVRTVEPGMERVVFMVDPAEGSETVTVEADGAGGAVATLEDGPTKIESTLVATDKVATLVELGVGEPTADMNDDPMEIESPVEVSVFVGEVGTPIDEEAEVGMDVGREAVGVPMTTGRLVDEEGFELAGEDTLLTELRVGVKVVCLMTDETVGVPIMATLVEVAGALVEALEVDNTSLSPIW